MKAFTDYPITEFGDAPYQEAPIRQVEVISYDGDKYCIAKLIEKGKIIHKSIKAGYLYTRQRRLGSSLASADFPQNIDTSKLPIKSELDFFKDIKE